MSRAGTMTGILIAVLLLSGVKISAQEQTTQYFVVVEITGKSVYCCMYVTPEEVKGRLADINAENAQRKKHNDGIDEEIKKLKDQIAAKNRDRGAATATEEDKARIDKEIEAIQVQITEKGKEYKELVKVKGPFKFRSQQEADDFMEKAYAEADKIREKAQEEAEAKAKAEREKNKN